MIRTNFDIWIKEKMTMSLLGLFRQSNDYFRLFWITGINPVMTTGGVWSVSKQTVRVLLAAFSLTAISCAQAQPEEESSDAPASQEEGDNNSDDQLGNEVIEAAARLRAAVARIDPNAEFFDNGANFAVLDTNVTLVYDINADRMRLVSAVAGLEGLGEAELLRLMQANFDSALDARYAVAQGALWSTFIHELSSLTADEFGSGVGQTVNLVQTFGTTFSSGALVFGGGDSSEEQRKLIEELQDKSREI